MTIILVLFFTVIIMLTIGIILFSRKTKVLGNQLGEMQEGQKQQEVFMAKTCHDLKSPLRGIISLAESMHIGNAGPVNQKLKFHLKLVTESSRRLVRLVGNLMEYSQLKNEKVHLNLRPTNLKAVADLVIHLVEGMAEKKELTIMNHLTLDSPLVLVDEDRLHQIFMNLLENAIKYTNVGYISLKSKATGNMVQIEVSDTGTGIKTENLSRIFETYTTENKKGSGYGLGLAVVKGLVEEHGGSIEVESLQGQGTTIRFFLPIASEPAGRIVQPAGKIVPCAFNPSELKAKPSSLYLPHGNQFKILVVDDDPLNCQVMANYLSMGEYKVIIAENGMQAIALIAETDDIDLILLDIMMPGLSGYEVCRKLRIDYDLQDLPIIFITALHQEQDIVRGFDKGANDFLSKPIFQYELLARVKTQLQLLEMHRLQKAETEYLREEIHINVAFDEIVGSSTQLKQVLAQVEQVSSTDASVLITGETGTGKELIARAIHNLGPRKHGPMIKINCAAIPNELFESELFGHEKGAFSGAFRRKPGKVEMADHGTLFLDEIGELSLHTQVKLLRFLQEGEFDRVGGHHTMKVDVRILAATNSNLEEEIEHKTFREDLFYRLNSFPIHVPALRQRKEDIPMLVEHFVQKICMKLGKPVKVVTSKIMNKMRNYHWPGNIRELENLCERAVIISRNGDLELGNWLQKGAPPSSKTLAEVERKYISDVLKQKCWRVSGEKGAAATLGLKSTTLEARMKKLDIKRPSKKTKEEWT